MGPKANVTHANQDLKLVQQMLGLTPGVEATLSDAVFVCIDCEAFESDHSKITEVGVAVLDTRDTIGIDAGKDGQGWIKKMQYAHYRPKQHAMLRNRKFVKGCEQGFAFGVSTWINLVDARSILSNTFRHPTRLGEAGNLRTPLSGPLRNIVFVGHGASSDTAFLKQLGFDLTTDADTVLTIDTQRMAGGSKKSGVKLQRLLLSLGYDPVNLHNAGNDAAYTLQAMVTMALHDHASPGSVAANLHRHQGKLPPFRYNRSLAPQIWAGTATEPAAKSSSVTLVERIEMRRPLPGQSSLERKARTAMHTQKPLPSPSCQTAIERKP
ncbi:hypothetical protein LTR53_004704 [Teratosphaeriaceae sp. CCFEE 6253]|nr:hypothetical protein LTR53_004704 [Teratosphaeriaceae sp. CCFEE 6253]